MKFICDVHISYKLVNFLNQLGHEAIHVNTLPDKSETSDYFIAQFADDFNRAVITKDQDFENLHFAKRTPISE